LSDKENKFSNIYLLISFPNKKEEEGEKHDFKFADKNCEIIFSEKLEKENENVFVILYNLKNSKKKSFEVIFHNSGNSKEKIEYKIKKRFR